MPTDTTSPCADAQQEFDSKYITASDIMKQLGVGRPVLLYARTTGKLPTPISLNEGRVLIWERSVVEPYLKKWGKNLKARRGQAE